jgi:hypothetical protein
LCVFIADYYFLPFAINLVHLDKWVQLLLMVLLPSPQDRYESSFMDDVSLGGNADTAEDGDPLEDPTFTPALAGLKPFSPGAMRQYRKS